MEESHFAARNEPRPPSAPDGESARASTPDDAEPIAAYLVLAAAFCGITSSALIWLRRRKLVLPKPGALDVLLIGLGTARLSRLITRDKVMRPLRAPFTVTERPRPGESQERAKGSGMVRAAGELITCPRCTAMWAASGLSLSYLASPNVGRIAGLILSSSLISDFVNRKFALLNSAPRNAS
ncbi:MAG TPA: DUF1360 domain-containing protein [Polyangiaceae bacterium]|nr:DUF1360 domain-containing protein [Polyangiaceae bacterium]